MHILCTIMAALPWNWRYNVPGLDRHEKTPIEGLYGACDVVSLPAAQGMLVEEIRLRVNPGVRGLSEAWSQFSRGM